MLTLKELSKELKISERTLRRYIKEGKLTAYKIAGKYRFSRELIDEFLKKMTT